MTASMATTFQAATVKAMPITIGHSSHATVTSATIREAMVTELPTAMITSAVRNGTSCSTHLAHSTRAAIAVMPHTLTVRPATASDNPSTS